MSRTFDDRYCIGEKLAMTINTKDYEGLRAMLQDDCEWILPGSEKKPVRQPENGLVYRHLSRRIAAFPPHAIARAKLAVDKGLSAPLDEGLWIEAEEFAACLARPDTAKRVEAVMGMGAQTSDGELNLPEILTALPLETST